MPAPKVFISYRRSDSSAIAGRIYDRLSMALGEANIFKDSYNIRPGDDFRGAIRDGVGQCDVVLVIIGKSWLTVAEANNPQQRRLDNPDDWVRIEVETGLQRQANGKVRVIPVLVQDASMPSSSELPETLRALAPKQAVKVRDDPDFPRDIKDLIDFLQKLNPDATSHDEPKAAHSSDRRLLEAAMPACSTLGAETQLKVKISLPSSPGLKAELPEVLPSGDIIQQGDVLATRFTMRFPKDASGAIQPGTVCIEVVSDDFNVSLARPASKNACDEGMFELRVPADDDSRTLNFRLTPKSASKTGLSTLYVSVYQNGDLITDTSVPTHIVRSMDELPICGDWRLNTAKAAVPQQEPQAPGDGAPARNNFQQEADEIIVQEDRKKREEAKPPPPVASITTEFSPPQTKPTSPATSTTEFPRPQAQPAAPPGTYLYQPSGRARSSGTNRAVISALVAIVLVAFAVIVLPTALQQQVAGGITPTGSMLATVLNTTQPVVLMASPTSTESPTHTAEPTATDTLSPSETTTPTSTAVPTVIPVTVPPSATAAANIIPVGNGAALQLFVDTDSLTLYVPEQVSLVGLELVVVINVARHTNTVVNDFSGLQLNGGVAFGGSCYVYYLNGTAPPLPSSCKDHVFKYPVSPSDVFWYDSVANRQRDVAIFQNGTATGVICSGASAECTVNWNRLSTPVVTAVLLTTNVVASYPCEGQIVVYVVNASLNVVHVQPFSTSSMAKLIEQGSDIIILSESDDNAWYQIADDAGNQLGYIPIDYVIASKSCPN